MASVSGSVENESMVQVDEEKIHGHVDEVVRSSVEVTLNGLLAAEADELCQVPCPCISRRCDRTCCVLALTMPQTGNF